MDSNKLIGNPNANQRSHKVRLSIEVLCRWPFSDMKPPFCASRESMRSSSIIPRIMAASLKAINHRLLLMGDRHNWRARLVR